MKKVDCIVVGLGLAGIHLSFELQKRNYSVHHIHANLPGESTSVAAGLINPITGRRFVKSWMIEEVMPYAAERYIELGQLLKSNYIDRMHIVRSFQTASDENTWLAKTADSYLSQFLLEKADMADASESLQLPELMGELKNCYRILTGELQRDYISYLDTLDSISVEEFDFEALSIEPNIRYQEVEAKHIFFAEGWRVVKNPFFEIPAFSPTKGELLIVKAPTLKLTKAYKKDMFITPLGNDLYWCGATSEWNELTVDTSEKMQNRLLEFVAQTIKVPFEIIHRRTGIRPSSKNRKPVLGTHPEYSKLHLFNGMGTKGSSLAPYFSSQLVDYIEGKVEIHHELNVQRYFAKKG